MLQVVIHEKGGQTQRFEFEADQFAIGREEDNDLVLDRVNVSKHHLRLRRHSGQIECIDLESTNGTYVNGRKVEGFRVVRRGDRIYIGDYILTLEGDDATIDPVESIERLADANQSDGLDEGALVTSARRVAAAGIESTYLDKLADRVLQEIVHAVPRLDPVKSGRADVPDEDRSAALERLESAFNIIRKTEDEIDADALEQRVASELIEYGPLSRLMRDDSVREIQVVGAGPIYVVREDEAGHRLENTRFTGPRALALAIRRLAAKRGLYTAGAQIIEGTADHGFYLYALLPPHQARDPVLCLRRVMRDAKSLSALVAETVLSEDMREFLVLMLRSCRRVLISASGGVNLDRFVRALIGEIPSDLRVACISDTGRLGAQHRGWVRVRRTRDPADTIALHSVLGTLLRGGLDLVISQQVGREDAASVIDAMAGASRGVVVSLWGINPGHSLSRLASLASTAGGAIDPLTRSLALAVDVTVQVSTGVNGEPMQIREIVAPKVTEGGVEHRNLYIAKIDEKDGTTQFRASPAVGTILRDFGAKGIEVPERLLGR
ncbi:MAG: Flp pilus assembly complex ATPase component TadA [Myxococcales bacterium]|nr:Flp pilus assembly complex ATPase component TadA [Myxococcales bacterium]